MTIPYHSDRAMQTQASTPNRAQRRAIAKRKVSAKEGQITAAGERMARNQATVAAQARAEAERAYALAQKTNDEPFSHANNVGRVAPTFAPLEQILRDIETKSEVLEDQHGMAVMYSAIDGQYYPMVQALVSMCDTFTKLGKTLGWNEDRTDGVRNLANRLELVMPVSQSDVNAAQQSIDWMKAQTLLVTPNQMEAEMVEVQIRDELAALA